MLSYYNPLAHPDGVPNPYQGHVSPYPTYSHGPDYTRPVFAKVWSLNPMNVLSGTPSADEVHWGQVAAGIGVGFVVGALVFWRRR